MFDWTARESFDAFVVGKRLGLVLIGVTLYFVVAGLIIQAFNLPAVNWGSGASVINTVILGLLLSFRNSAAYQRWWEARGHWGKLTNDSRNLAAKLAAFIPADVLAESRAGETLAGFAVALKCRLREEPLWLADLPGFAIETIEPPHLPLYLAQRLFTLASKWKEQGIIDQATLWILDEHMRGLLDVCGACEKIRYTPLSPSYKALLRIGLVLNVLAEPWLTVPENGFWACPVFMLVCFFLFGVELIDSIVEEPFGRERDDLNLDRYCETIRESVAATGVLSNA